jgi:threonine/homoserine/homoserine lactone efflux protein
MLDGSNPLIFSLATLFFMAFIPQFVDPASGPVGAQTVAMGGIFLTLTVIVFVAYGMSAAMIRKWVIERPRVQRMIDWTTGSLFVFLGIRLALSSRQ